MSTTTRDGRSLRDQRHRAIVDAARTLSTSHGAQGFTVEQVAGLAGVSRRTVFNHFAGLDQLLVAVCEQILAEVVAELLEIVDRRTAELPDGPAGGRLALDVIHGATQGVDLPSAIVAIHHVLGRPEGVDERAEAISRSAFEQAVGRLRERLLARAPSLQPLDVELTLALLTSGLSALAQHWLDRHREVGPDVPPDARADWDRLLHRLLHRLRSGYAALVPPD